jgi:trehalose 6-phosphate phosphatase
MSVCAMSIADLPNALGDRERFDQQMAGRTPAVFLDYDGTLTPIVDRPEAAVISQRMRDAVRALALRCTVCVVSGRDRPVVQELMGIDDLVVAGSHGFDIWDPRTGTLEHDAATGFEPLLAEITDRLRTKAAAIEGALVEPKRASVALHYRLVAPEHRPAVAAVLDQVLAEHPDQLKVTPGKLVYEVQPKIDWHKGKAVLYLIAALHLDGDGIVPLYLGDDITDEDAFRALSGRGIGIVVADLENNPREATRDTAADFALNSMGEVERFLNTLAH